MSTNTTIAVIDGVMRLRTGLAGHDLKDPALDERYLTFDSAWTNSFRLLKGGVVAGSSLTLQVINYPIPAGATGNRGVRRIPVTGATTKTPALAWAVAGSGSVDWYPAGRLLSLGGIATSYVKAYRTCAVNIAADEIKVSPSYSSLDYAYLVFQTDATAPESTGPNGGRFGVHPLYGMGAYISRPGFDHLTCSLDDMMLTTGRNMVQIHETGMATPTQWVLGGARAIADAVAGGPFSDGSGLRYAVRLTLNGSYPDHPPVVAYRMDTGFSDALPSIFWLSDNEIIISNLLNDDSVRYAVLAVSPSYTPDVDTGRIRRIRFVDGALDITQHNVNWEDATEAQFLFRSSRLTPRLTGFDLYPTSFPTGVYNLPSPSPTGAGPQFAFFLTYEPYGGWWCGCGYSDMQDIIGSSGVYNSWWRAAVINRSQYRWYKDPSVAPSWLGWVVSANVSDF